MNFQVCCDPCTYEMSKVWTRVVHFVFRSKCCFGAVDTGADRVRKNPKGVLIEDYAVGFPTPSHHAF